MKGKIAIVCSGGGMRCSYSAGVLVALGKEYQFFVPDIIIGASGSAGNILYYVTGQLDSIERIWTHWLANKKFISFFRFGRIMNIDYLIDGILKKEEVMNVEKLREANIKYFIPLCNAENGGIKYFTNEDQNEFEVLRAAKSIPLITRNKVMVGNSNYCDGRIGTNLQKDIAKAIQEGAKVVVAIANSQNLNHASFFRRLYAWLGLNSRLRKVFLNNKEEIINNLGRVKIIYIKAPTLPVGLLTIDKEKLMQSFQLGYNDVKNNKELQELFGGR